MTVAVIDYDKSSCLLARRCWLRIPNAVQTLAEFETFSRACDAPKD